MGRRKTSKHTRVKIERTLEVRHPFILISPLPEAPETKPSLGSREGAAAQQARTVNEQLRLFAPEHATTSKAPKQALAQALSRDARGTGGARCGLLQRPPAPPR